MYGRCKILFFSLSLFYSSLAAAQPEDISSPLNFIQIRWDNDFLYGTDYYRSNAFFFSIESGFMDHSPLRHILLPYPQNSSNWHGLDFSHEFYTPVDIYSEEIQYGDRPYAGVLLLGNSRYSERQDRGLVLRSSIQLGLMGPLAGGEQMQNGIHGILWTSNPAKGWDNQISNEFCLLYNAGVEKRILDIGGLMISAHLDGSLGIPYTNLTPKLQMLFGKYLDPYHNKGFARTGWQLYFRASAWASMVLYNGTIEGGILNTSSPYTTEIENFVPGYNAGLFLAFRQFRLGMEHTRIAPEFTNGMYHNYSSFRFDFSF